MRRPEEIQAEAKLLYQEMLTQEKILTERIASASRIYRERMDWYDIMIRKLADENRRALEAEASVSSPPSE